MFQFLLERAKVLLEDYESINGGFPYTGKLRCYKVTPKREVPKK